MVSPRLLRAERAAEYCGVGVTLFRRQCPVAPVNLGDRVLWDVRALDDWIDSLNFGRKKSDGNSGEEVDVTGAAVRELAEYAKAKKKNSGRRNQNRSV